MGSPVVRTASWKKKKLAKSFWAEWPGCFVPSTPPPSHYSGSLPSFLIVRGWINIASIVKVFKLGLQLSMSQPGIRPVYKGTVHGYAGTHYYT